MPFFYVVFLLSSPASCPTLSLFRIKWLNFYPSFNLPFILPFPVLLTVVITSVCQSKMSLSRVSPFLLRPESFLSCRNLHVKIQQIIFIYRIILPQITLLKQLTFQVFSLLSMVGFGMLIAFLSMMHSVGTFPNCNSFPNALCKSKVR